MGAEAQAAPGATSTEERFVKVIHDYIGGDKSAIQPAATFDKDLDCDSLDIVEIVMATEEEFGIEITDDESLAINTVADGLALITTKLP
jgi:acyl carrier protein